jgi:hypothetical protein
LRRVCGFRFIEAAAGAVGKTSGRSVFIAIDLRGEVRSGGIACYCVLMAKFFPFESMAKIRRNYGDKVAE